MDVFALLFIVSFLALIFTLAVMHIRKHTKTKDNVAKGSKHIGWVSDVLGRGSESTELHDDDKMHNVIVGKTSYVRSYDLESFMMQREVNETQDEDGNIMILQDCMYITLTPQQQIALKSLLEAHIDTLQFAWSKRWN